MSNSICGAKCEDCGYSADCRGCAETCGRPFGGSCIAAEYIKVGGKEKYAEFKAKLLIEINALLTANGIPEAEKLYELAGEFVNLEYTLPNSSTAKFLDDTRVYLGCQIEFADMGVCYGAVAGMDFILVCSYSVNGSQAELIAYQKR